MFKFDPVAFGADIAKLRENGVAVANKTDDVARHALGGLRAGELTQSAVTIAALAAHGNPKTPKGKAVDSINGLRYAKGGEAARNCFRAVFEIDDNVKAYGEALPAIGEAIDAYVEKTDGAAKGLFVLRDAVRAMLKAKLQADDPKSAEVEAEVEAEAKAEVEAEAKGESVQEAISGMIGYIHNLSVEDIAANEESLANLMAVIRVASERLADAAPLADAA